MLVDFNNTNHSSNLEVTVLASSKIDTIEDLINSSSGNSSSNSDSGDNEVVVESYNSSNTEVYITQSSRVYNLC
jgi:hypothetical protein